MKFTIPTKQLRLICQMIAINRNKMSGNFKVEIDHDGISIQSVDPANVWLLKIHIPKLCFRPYGVVTEPATVGYDVDEFIALLAEPAMDFSDLVTINRDKFECGPYTATLHGYDPDLLQQYREVRIPPMPEPSVRFAVDSTLFLNSLKLLKPEVTFRHMFDFQRLSLKSNKTGAGVDLSGMVTLYEHSDEPAATLIDIKEVRLIDVLAKLNKYVGTVDVQFSMDMPLVIEATDDFNTKYEMLFAPRIESQ